MNFKPEISFSTRIRKSPFFESTMKWGCKGFTVYNKMYMPTYYKTFVDDYWSLVSDVTLWDVAGERQVEIKGKDAERFVEFITPRDISKCKVKSIWFILDWSLIIKSVFSVYWFCTHLLSKLQFTPFPLFYKEVG